MNDFLTLGIVSNVWADLLPILSLNALCRHAADQGHGYVELRQGALGDCEEQTPGAGPPLPIPSRLAALAAGLPELTFNLAVEAPFLTPGASLDPDRYDRCLEAALAFGCGPATCGGAPLLRLVDIHSAQGRLTRDEFVAAVRGTVDLAERAAELGVRLALENAREPLSLLLDLLEAAGRELGDERAPLLCWDAVNMLSAVVQEQPVRVLSRLRPAALALFHFKQTRGGAPQPAVSAGDVDWGTILRSLRDSGYAGPALFEIPPGPNAWDRLAASRDYISRLLEDVD